jgi:hypothetical protein
MSMGGNSCGPRKGGKKGLGSERRHLEADSSDRQVI